MTERSARRDTARRSASWLASLLAVGGLLAESPSAAAQQERQAPRPAAGGGLAGGGLAAPPSAVGARNETRQPSPGGLALPQQQTSTEERPVDDTARNVTASLAIVLGLFFLAVFVAQSKLARPAGGLPAEAAEVLGRTALGPRQSMLLIRAGGKLLLVASHPQGATTLTEITDPDEVAKMTELCRRRGGVAAVAGVFSRGGADR